MMRFALIGHPLGHSMSADYFADKFEREGLRAEYSLLDIERVEEVLPYAEHLSGFNVTIPHKQSIIPLLSAMSEEARAVGAVNCVKVTSEGLVGYNTDVVGIRKSLEGVALQGKRALVLGTGGASKAVQYVLREGGAEVQVVSRRGGEGYLSYADITVDLLSDINIVVNATPVGMSPNVDNAPDIAYEGLSSRHTLFDVIYNPLETKFLKLGKQHNCHTIGGMTMFTTQAEASWAIWNK